MVVQCSAVVHLLLIVICWINAGCNTAGPLDVQHHFKLRILRSFKGVLRHATILSSMLIERPQSNFAVSDSWLITPTADTHLSEVLLDRVSSEDYSAFRPGLRISDFDLPAAFTGEWNTSSIFLNLVAPLGVDAVGGFPVYERARRDLNTALSYVSRFNASSSPQGRAVYDRLFNVQQIAAASMGPNSVVLDPSAAADANYNTRPAERLDLMMTPRQGLVFKVKLVVTDRVQSQSSPYSIELLERTRQASELLLRLKSGPAGAPLEKEIETVTVYRKVSDSRIEGLQRTATFLSPRDPRYSLAVSREPRVSSGAIDIRFYKLSLEKLP